MARSPLNGHDFKFEIWPVEAGVNDVGVGNAKLREHVFDDFRRGGGREGEHRRPAEIVDRLAEGQELGSKVMPPLTHAVRFVHHDHVDLLSLEQFAVLGNRETLGSGVDELHFAGGDRLLGVAQFTRRERAVHGDGSDPLLLQPIDLILHQCDQRTDDDRCAFELQRGQLKADALARAGGHDHERVAAFHRRLDGFDLPRAEAAKTEMLTKPIP